MRNPTIYRTPHAGEVTLFNRDSTSGVNDYDSDNVQGGMEEIDFRQVTLEPTGFKNTRYDSTVTFSEGSRQFSIAPASVSGSYDYYIRGHRFRKTTTDTVTIDNTGGLWFIFFNGSTLTASQTPWLFDSPLAFVHTIHWNNTYSKATLLIEERHGLTMDWATHRYLHSTHGIILEKYKFEASNYILRGDGSLDAHATIGFIDLGRVFDEDIDALPVNSASPTLPYEQKISPILWAPVLYASDNPYIYNKINATQFPLAWTAGQRISYNPWTGSAWQLTQASEGYFVNMYVCLTLDARHPFIIITGHFQYPTLVEAAAERWSHYVDELPSPEIYPLFKLIYKTSSLYTNQPKAVLFAVLDVNQLTTDNDRYTVEVGYNGNAGAGKYMDRSWGTSSIDNPFIFPEASFIRFIELQSQTGTLSTATVGLFKTTDLVNPVMTISLSNQNYVKGSYSQYFSADDQIVWKVISGSINKPGITNWIQTQLG